MWDRPCVASAVVARVDLSAAVAKRGVGETAGPAEARRGAATLGAAPTMLQSPPQLGRAVVKARASSFFGKMNKADEPKGPVPFNDKSAEGRLSPAMLARARSLFESTAKATDLDTARAVAGGKPLPKAAALKTRDTIYWYEVNTFLRMVGANPRAGTVEEWAVINEDRLRAGADGPRLLPGVDYDVEEGGAEMAIENMQAINQLNSEAHEAAAAAAVNEASARPSAGGGEVARQGSHAGGRALPGAAASSLPRVYSEEEVSAERLLRVTWAEALHLWFYVIDSSTDELELLKAAFKYFDRDGDGNIGADEFRVVMTELGGEPLSDEDIAVFMGIMDKDGNNLIDIGEFIEALSTNSGLLMGAKDKEAFAIANSAVAAPDTSLTHSAKVKLPVVDDATQQQRG